MSHMLWKSPRKTLKKYIVLAANRGPTQMLFIKEYSQNVTDTFGFKQSV